MAGSANPQNVYQQSASALTGAQQTAGNLAQFKPTNVQAPEQIGVNQLATTDLSQYMNPYTQNVIEQGQADIERQRQMASNTLGAQAQAAGAFGGSRQAIQEGVLAGEAARQASQLSAQQRQGAYNQALAAGQFDIGQTQAARNLAAQQAMQANMANYQGQFQGAGVRSGAASQLGNLAQTGFGFGQQIGQQQMQQGLMQQGLQQSLIDAARGQYTGFTGAPQASLSLPLAALGAQPNQSTTTQSKNPGLFDYLALAATAASGSNFGSSDIRLKESIKPLGTEGGINVYSWDWNEDGKRVADPAQPTFGVMAQELQETHPHLVHLGPDGFLRVDYKGLAAEMA